MRRSLSWLLAFAALSAVVALSLAVLASASARTVLRGLADPRLTDSTVPIADRLALVDEVADKLNGRVVRLDCYWPLGEPSRAVYDDDGYLADLKTVADAAHAKGLKVIVLIVWVPRWASAATYWGDPPSSQYSGYQPFYPVAAAHLDDLGAFAEHVATLLQGDVLGYECWDEPNLWPYLYPQRTSSDPEFAAHTYLEYLCHMSAGIRAGDPGALVIGGVTAPTGANDIYRTAPQTFAAELKALGAGAYFDVYSHHPYCVGGRADLDPGLPPVHPDQTVELSNIGTLLKIFPKKPFYLTEYGFSTHFSWAFGAAVTETRQACYLRKAYRMAAAHRQIKLLLWFTDRDSSPTGRSSDPDGNYVGLRRLTGAAKPAWFAFAGGDRLTLVAPTVVRRGAWVRLHGRLTCATVGGLRGKRLVVRCRRGRGPWRVLRTVVSASGGYYHASVRVGATQRYRLTWTGVVSSPSRLVRAD
jgi:hypothetical protein